MISDLTTIVPFIWDSLKGNYCRIPIFTIVGICIALLYFISPIDFIPDLILGIGFADDLLFLLAGGAVGGHLDLAKYRKWRDRRDQWLDERLAEFNFGGGHVPHRKTRRRRPTPKGRALEG